MKLWQLFDARKRALVAGEAAEVARLDRLIEARVALIGGAA
ncbi:hypothetical protein [Pseudoxanthomonas winnipegensis]|nr:hypothetical protein [Pseudoxanthomonas winnipegensis]